MFFAPLSTPRFSHILPSPMVSLFFVADHIEARITSIVGRYSTINSASGVNANIQGIAWFRTKKRPISHVLFTRRLFLFRHGKEPFLFRFYHVPPKFIPPPRGSQPRFYPPATCMFVKQKNPPPRDYSEACGIISRIKAARFGAISSDTAGILRERIAFNLSLLR